MIILKASIAAVLGSNVEGIHSFNTDQVFISVLSKELYAPLLSAKANGTSPVAVIIGELFSLTCTARGDL